MNFLLLCGEDRPVAILTWASWPQERVVEGTLGTIAGLMAADPVERTGLILVGPALRAEEFRESTLYDVDYRRRFR